MAMTAPSLKDRMPGASCLDLGKKASSSKGSVFTPAWRWRSELLQHPQGQGLLQTEARGSSRAPWHLSDGVLLSPPRRYGAQALEDVFSILVLGGGGKCPSLLYVNTKGLIHKETAYSNPVQGDQ